MDAGRRRRELPAAQLPEGIGADDIADRQAVGALVRQALAGLPRQQRAVLVLRYCEDLPEAEVAELLGCSVGTVKTHAHRGAAALRERLGGEFGRLEVTRRGRRGVTSGEPAVKEQNMNDTEEVRRLFAVATEDMPPGIDLLAGVRARSKAQRTRVALSAGVAGIVATATAITVSAVQAPSALAQVTQAAARTAGQSYRVSSVSTPPVRLAETGAMVIRVPCG